MCRIGGDAHLTDPIDQLKDLFKCVFPELPGQALKAGCEPATGEPEGRARLWIWHGPAQSGRVRAVDRKVLECLQERRGRVTRIHLPRA